MFTFEELDRMSEMDFEDIDVSELVDIKTIHIDPYLPLEERVLSFLEQIKNPYFFISNGSIVKMSFEKDGPDLRTKLKNYFISLKES